MNKKSQWYRTMKKLYGSDEAIAAKMAENGLKGRKPGTGGFASMTREQVVEVGRKGGYGGKGSKKGRNSQV